MGARAIAGGMAKTLCRLYPLMIGGARIANTRPWRWMTAGRGICAVRIGRHTKLLVNSEDFIGRSIFFFGDFDRKVTEIFARLLREGDTVVDVGANCGLLTLYAAERVGKDGQVHAFEPQPGLASLVEKSASLNGYRHVRVHQVALSMQAGEFDMVVPQDNSGAAALDASGGSTNGAERIRVSVKAAGEYLESLSLPRVRLMKLDVEGHEAAVLSGAKDWLKSNRPAAILFESKHAPGAGAVFKLAPFEILDLLGYEIFAISRDMWRLSLLRIHRDHEVVHHAHDYVAVDPAERSVKEALGIA